MDSYWEKRQVEMYKSCEGMTNRYFGDLQKAFLEAKRAILKEINDFYVRYAGESGLSYQDAQKRITETELGGLNDFIRKAYDHIGEYDDEVERLSIKSRVTRLQEMEARINAYLDQLYAIDYQHNGEELLHSVSDNAYYRTWYNIDQFKGAHDGFNGIDPRRIDKMIEYPFNGQNFSTRIWKQKEYLGGQLMESFTQMLVQGKNPKVLAADFAKKFGTSEMAAYRLLHTEASYIIAETAHAAYKEDGVEEYVIIAALDSKTCPVCGTQDGKHYPVKDAVAGINMEPFHPNCRCTDAPYFPDFNAGTRVAKDDKGKNYEVPADMTYEEWKEKFAYAKQNGDVVMIPHELDGDFSDYSKLDFDKETEDALRTMLKKTSESDCEYAFVKSEEGIGEIYTSGYHDKVQFDVSAFKGNSIELYHTHTNMTVPSMEDLEILITKDNVASICNIVYNGDAYQISIGSGIKPSVEEFWKEIKSLDDKNLEILLDNKNSVSWTGQERMYYIQREKFYRITRLFGWEVKGGRINV